MSAPPPLDADQTRLLDIQQLLSSSIETLARCSAAVDAPSAEKQAQMHTDLGALILQFRALNDLSQQFAPEFLIPGEVFGRVEAEQNPDLVTRAQLQVARVRNDETRGRLLATQALRDHMAAGLSALDDVPDLSSAPANAATGADGAAAVAAASVSASDVH